MLPIEKIGGWAFILGVLVAVVAGLAQYGGALTDVYETVALGAIVILGLVVGFLNIGEKEIKDFLIAAIALLLVGSADIGVLSVVGLVVAKILSWIAAFVAPAALVVSLKAVYNLASKPSA